MSNNKIGLNLGDLVLANGIEGEVIGFGTDSALIKLSVVIDGQVKVVQQWYSNDALKKIETGIYPASTRQAATEIVEGVVKEAEKTLEFGVLPENTDEYVIGIDLAKDKDQSFVPKVKNKSKKKN